jgi:hypothetical protein
MEFSPDQASRISNADSWRLSDINIIAERNQELDAREQRLKEYGKIAAERDRKLDEREHQIAEFHGINKELGNEIIWRDQKIIELKAIWYIRLRHSLFPKIKKAQIVK